MSSSRSIAAARQKRAGEQTNNNNISSSRPVTSISSQAVFAQQQYSKQPQVGNRNSQQNVNQMKSNQQPINIPQKPKISISDAIGLITLRLGKMEKFIHESMEDGSLNFGSNSMNYENSNMKLVSDEVFENLTSRLDKLEKNTTSNNTNHLTEQITKMTKEMKDLKSSINTLNMKLTSFMKDTQDKFTDFENAIVEIEKSLDANNNNENFNNEQELLNVEENNNETFNDYNDDNNENNYENNYENENLNNNEDNNEIDNIQYNE
jgi:predicted DNA-binding protein